MSPTDTTLLVIDVQKGLDDNTPFHGGHRNNPQIEHTISILLTLFRTRNLPIFHVKHNSRDPSSTLHPSHPGNAIFPFAIPSPSRPIDEPLYEKSVHSAFIGTSLEADLHARGITRLFVCGFTSNMCVNTTVRMAENLGFEVFVVEDACATFDRVGPDGVPRRAEDVHAYAMSNLHGEFCTVVKSSDVQGLLGN